MLFAMRCSPALHIQAASPRRSNHFVSAPSAHFQEKPFYAPFVFNTLRTPCIVKFPSTPAFPEACALFGEKHGYRGYRSLSPLFSSPSALFPTGTLSFRGNGGTCFRRCSSCEQGRFTSSTAVHNDSQTVHFAAKTCNTRAFRCKNVSPQVDSGTHARTTERALGMNNARGCTAGTERKIRPKAPPHWQGLGRKSLPLAGTPAIHESALNAEVILSRAAEVRIEVIELDRTQRDMLRQSEVRAAADRPTERVGRCRQTRCSGRVMNAAEQRLNERAEASIAASSDAGPKQIVDLASGASRRHSGDLAATEIADDARPIVQADGSRARSSLAVGAGGATAGIDANELIVAANFEILGLGRSRDHQHKAEQNTQLTHSSLHLEFPHMGSVL